MFRIGLKFPCNGLNRVKKHGYSRLYLTARYYDTRTRAKCEPDGRFNKDVKLMSRYSGYKYSTETPRSEKRGSGALITLGAVTIGAIGVLTYAKNSPEFRATLEGWVPGTDKTIQIIFQEESSYFEFIRAFFESLKQTLLTMIFGDASEKTPAPKPAFTPLVAKKEPPTNEPFSEIRVTKEKGEKIEVVAEKPPPPKKNIPEELKPASLVELETICGKTAAEAIAAYRKAMCAIQDYNQDIIKIVESAGATLGRSVWDRLKEATEKRKEEVQKAEAFANSALASVNKMYDLIDDPKLEAPSHVKTVARRNVKQFLDDVSGARKEYEDQVKSGNISERYWKQVKMSREHFNEELQILFPNINIHEKKFSVNEDAFDLFVVYMYNKVNNIMKELERQRTVGEQKLKAALKAVGEEANQKLIDERICLAVEKERQTLEDEFNIKLLEEQKKFQAEMKRQLKLQAEIYADQLRETFEVKERETQRIVNRALSEQSEADSMKHKRQLATIVGRLKGLEAAIKARTDKEKVASNAQILWSACQALARAVKTGLPGVAADKAIRPLEPEIKAVFKAAPKEDPLIKAVIQGIPEEAAKRGVFPEDALRERFLKVENVARRLAMVPEQGAALPIYLLSYLQSLLIIKTANPIPKSELENEPIDIQSLNTYDILHRARYWMDRGDFKMTLRYMNLLKGAPRSVARDWMNEARILLETQQAIETLLAYAGAAGLIFLGAGDSKVSETK